MGISLASMQRADEAVVAYRSSIESALKSPGAARAGDPYWNLALALRTLGRVSETVEALEAFIDLAPADDKRLINARSQLAQDRGGGSGNFGAGGRGSDDGYAEDDYYGEGDTGDDDLYDDEETEADLKLQFVNALGTFATA